MKTKVVASILGLAACSLAAFAQSEQAGIEGQSVGESAILLAAADTTVESSTVETSAVDTATVVIEESPVAENTAAESQDSRSAAIIPLIAMENAELSDAIRNLARQAGINYMLDPRISFLQPGADGRAAAQPIVSIRWENVTAEQALNALLNNYNLQLVDDSKTKISRVTMKDPAAPDPLFTRIVQLKYSSPSNLLAAVQSTFTDPRRSKVMPDVRTSQLVLVATEAELESIDQIVSQLDLPTRQVLIQARLLETSLNPRTIKGIDWSGTLEAQNVRFGNNLRVTDPSESANNLLSDGPKFLMDTAKGFNPATAFLDADGVSAVLSFINKNSEAKVISSPQTVTLDNEMAQLAVTRARPIINVTAGTANTTGGSQITYTNLGVLLSVTPRISANDNINLHVVPEVSRLSNIDRKIIGNQAFEADVYDIRRMETRVMVPSGNTLVLGGLIQDDLRTSNTKVPLLGDIPYLGGAFRKDEKERQKNNLIVFITPTIVKDSDFRPTSTDFLQTPMTEELDKDWSAWDSGKPYDWSKVRKDRNFDEQAANSTY